MTDKLSTPPPFTAQPSRKHATILQAVGGYLNTAIVIIQGLLLIPLYLYHIGSHTYGLWLASGGILGMLGIMNFGIGSMLIQRIASSYGKKEFAQAGMYFINGMMVYVCIALLMGGVGWSISFWLPVILKVDGDDAELLMRCFQIAALAMVIAVLNECLRSFSQALLRPVFPMFGMAVGRVIGIAMTVWMLFDDFGLWAIPVGTLTAESLIFILNLIYSVILFQRLETRVILDKKIIKEFFRTGPVLLMATAGNTLSQEAEPLLITMFLSPEVTTAYMVTRRAADIVFNLLSQVVGSILGSFGHLVGEGNAENVSKMAYALLSLIALLGLAGFSIYIAMNASFVGLWVGEEFVLSPMVIAFLGLAFFIRIVRSMTWQLLNGLGDFVYTSLCILFEGIVRVCVIVLLLPVMGIGAVPLALLLAATISFLFLTKRIHHMIPSDFDWVTVGKFILSFIVLLCGSAVIETLIDSASWGSFLVYLAAVSCVSLSVVLAINWKMIERMKSVFL